MTKDTPLHIALETMAGKGSELGRSFEELAAIYDGVVYSDKLRVCFDTCHTHDSGYDIRGNFDGVIDEFDHLSVKIRLRSFILTTVKMCVVQRKTGMPISAPERLDSCPLLYRTPPGF